MRLAAIPSVVRGRHRGAARSRFALPRRSRQLAFGIAALAASLQSPLCAAQANAQSAFEQGIDAYHAGKPDAALQAFLSAYQQGLRSPNLDFNIGLSYYRLGQYEQARIAFERLAQAPAYAAIADYHLGLVAAASGQDEQAIAHLRAAESGTDSAQLKNLAALALHRLDAQPPTPTVEATVLAALGYDSDPALLSDSVTLAANQKADAFADLAAALAAPLWQRDDQALVLRGSGYARQYQHDQDFNQQAGQLSLGYAFGRVWRTTITAEGETAFLGGDRLQNAGGLSLESARIDDAATLRLHYRLHRIGGGSAYQYLDGWRQQIGVDYALPIAGTRSRFDYEFEANDRRDLSQGGEFFSESPQRHSVGMQLRRQLDPRWTLQARARYRYDRYRDDDQILVNGALLSQRRVDQLTQLALGTELRLNNNWSGLLEYQYSRNQSVYAGYDYQRHLITLSLAWDR